jgi:hypothetical protein
MKSLVSWFAAQCAELVLAAVADHALEIKATKECPEQMAAAHCAAPRSSVLLTRA